MTHIILGLVFGFTTSGHSAPEKSDLTSLVQTFDEMVLSAEVQDEYQFTQEWVELKAQDEDVTKEIVKSALDRFGGNSLERLEFKALSLFEQKDLYSEVIDPMFTSWSLPYFCGTFKKLQGEKDEQDWWTDEWAKDCKELTRKLLKDVVSREASSYLVIMEGDGWGEYRQALLWVQSEKNPNQFLVYDFDLVHEI
ncbi:MAG: hypothetical protein A3B70_01555 [Deltaproteobacteria bacterium RIFCSPHIGHO2_02_FULL_40_11]|nr:MAG: hypothetical protein A3B70_01555 [Deltaproteobacteria bacterium RIFCSPHIGHO2_02_FULL_40_11]